MKRFIGRVERIVEKYKNYIEKRDVMKRLRDKKKVIKIGLEEYDYYDEEEKKKERWRERFKRNLFILVGVMSYYKGIRKIMEEERN